MIKYVNNIKHLMIYSSFGPEPKKITGYGRGKRVQARLRRKMIEDALRVEINNNRQVWTGH